jgi:hypothetical protein
MFKLYITIYHGEQGEIPSQANVHTGMKSGSVLTDQDVARAHLLAAELLDTQPLGLTIPAITAGPTTLFVSH